MFTKFFKNSSKFTPNKAQRIAGLLGADHGGKAGQLFRQLDMDCADLSKRTGIDKNDLMDKTINLAKTTTLNFDEAFRSIKRIVLGYTNQPTVSELALTMGVQCGKSTYQTEFIKYIMHEHVRQHSYRHMWE